MREDNNYIFPFLWMRGEGAERIHEEMEKIYACGIRSVCVEARPHPEFGKEQWWKDMETVLETAEVYGMTVWILDDKHFPTGYANGLIEEKYPERRKLYLNYNICDVNGTGQEMTFDIGSMKQPLMKFWEMDKPVNMEERRKNKIKAVLLLRLGTGCTVYEDITDVTGQMDKNEMLTVNIQSGSWRIMTVYSTRTDGGNESYINMLDGVSCRTQLEAVYIPHYERFGARFGTTIRGFFSDEPQFGNEPLFPFDSIVGKKDMPIPWSSEMEERMIDRYGKAWKEKLPYLWFDSEEMRLCPEFRYHYMDCASALYRDNFSRQIGDWCREHGVEYIGHVVEDNNAHARLGMGAAHYFRAMDGQDMAGIDAIGGQIVQGGADRVRRSMTEIDGEFFYYTLGKLGASCAHLDPRKKGRLMCELFGASGWQTGVKEMRYILDHLLIQGVNCLVPHAFSMAEYPDPDCPPHFYAGGNNPEYPYFAELMKYANRMCALLNGGVHVANIAVLYDAELEWCGNTVPMQKVIRILLRQQLDLEIICMDMLKEKERYGTVFEEDALIINGMKFDALIIPPAERIPAELLKLLEDCRNLRIYFIDRQPEPAAGMYDGRMPGKVVALDELGSRLRTEGIYDLYTEEVFPELSAYHYRKEKQDIYMFQNGSAEKIYRGNVVLKSDAQLEVYDGMKREHCLARQQTGERMSSIYMELLPGESIVFVTQPQKNNLVKKEYEPMSEILNRMSGCISLDKGWTYAKVRAIDYPEFGEAAYMEKLIPVSQIEPAFSGVIRYEKTVNLPAVKEAYLSVERVHDVMCLEINGIDMGRKISAPFLYDITDVMKEGENEIILEVATTLEREQQNYPVSPFIFSFEGGRPTGISGAVEITYN